MFTLKLFLTLSLNVLACLLVKGDRFSGLGGEEVASPFGSCKIYKLGGINGLPLTEKQPLKDVSQLAFYPLNNENVMLYLHLMFPEAIFKVKIEGSMVTLEKCEGFERNCKKEEQEGVKYGNYIKPQEWNNVTVKLSAEELAIYVGPRMVKSMSMLDYKALQRADWSVLLGNTGVKGYKSTTRDLEYLVQFMCEEYISKHPTETEKPHYTVDTREETYNTSTEKPKTDVPYPHETTMEYSHETPVPHVEIPHESKSGNGTLVGLIVGVVVAAIILIALAIVLYNVIRKRRSANLNEDAPLQKTTK